jgi:hypothetical protein
MRYLNNRYDFLDRYNKVNEGTRSGPFENDIPWGDSLVGRLIMATIRKSSIAINVTRIDKLTERLKEQFSYMVDGSMVDMSNEKVATDISKTTIFALLKELKDGVDSGKDNETLISLTDSTIVEVEKAEIDEAKKTKLVDQLNKFKEFLKNQPKESGEVVDDKSKYPLMIKNLKALSLILSNYSKVKLGVELKTQPKPAATETATTKPEVKTTTAPVETVKPAPATKPAPKPELVKTGPHAGFFNKSEKIQSFGDFAKILEADRTNPLGNKPGANIDRNNVTSGEDHVTQSFNKLKKAIEVLISPKEKGIAVDVGFINDLVKNSVNSDSKELIKSLYTEINRYLVGDKKATLQDKEALYKEGIEVLSDKNKLVIVAEKIARFAKRALQFDGENLYGSVGDLKVPLKDFVDSMKLLMNEKPVKEEGQDEKTGDSVKDYFYANVDYEPFAVDESERQRIEKEIVASDNAALDYDSVVEVLKLFNRAYKLHTTATIPGGRSGGAVSRSVYNEYTAFGGNSGNSGTSDGPYRNNKIFDKWEDAVLDILKTKKYQVLFLKTTKLKVGGELRANGGAIFRKLITDLLDGERLYKQGAQEKFLKEYFGGDADGKSLETLNNEDKKANAEVAKEIKEVKLAFVENSVIAENEDIKNKKYDNKFLQLKGEDGKVIYVYVDTVGQNSVGFSYCTSIYYFKKYIEEGASSSIKGYSGMIKTMKGEKDNYRVRYTRMSIDDFAKLLNKSPIILNSSTIDFKIEENRDFKLTSVSWLCDEADSNAIFSVEDAKVNKSKLRYPSECATNLNNIFGKKFENDFKPVSKIG